jgi:crotonobetainyl-CoA:carnitine CoA-transferase CaiB-like acyl-CoA transferase
MGEPFKVLQHYYADRAAGARESQSHGVGVVGRVGNTIPSEFVNAGLPASVVRTLQEMLEHPHLRARGTLAEVDAPDLGRTATVVGAGFRFEHEQPRFQGPVPRRGQHTAQVIAGLHAARPS